jgi:hypothetical protein
MPDHVPFNLGTFSLQGLRFVSFCSQSGSSSGSIRFHE